MTLYRKRSAGSSSSVFIVLALFTATALIALFTTSKTKTSELAVLRSSQESAKSDIANLSTKITEQEESVNTLKNIVKSITLENTELQSANHELRVQNSQQSIAEELDGAEKLKALAAAKAKLDELETLRGEYLAQKGEVDKLRAREGQIIEAKNAATASLKEVEILTAENYKLKAALVQLEEKIVTMQNQLATRKSQDTSNAKSESNIVVVKKTTDSAAAATVISNTVATASTSEFKKALDTLAPEVRKNLTFAGGSAWLNFNARATLDKVALLLTKSSKLKMSIGGHTDHTGDEITNLKLSKQRAERVRDYLISRNVGPDQLKAKGFGSSQPLPVVDVESGLTNRRVEFTAS